MKPIVVLALLLSCCAQSGARPQAAEMPTYLRGIAVPDDLKGCPAGVPQTAAPPAPRTLEHIVDAYNRAKEAGLATEAALKSCAAKLDRLNRLITATP